MSDTNKLTLNTESILGNHKWRRPYVGDPIGAGTRKVLFVTKDGSYHYGKYDFNNNITMQRRFIDRITKEEFTSMVIDKYCILEQKELLVVLAAIFCKEYAEPMPFNSSVVDKINEILREENSADGYKYYDSEDADTDIIEDDASEDLDEDKLSDNDIKDILKEHLDVIKQHLEEIDDLLGEI